MKTTIEMARQAGLEMDDSLVLEPEVIWYMSQGQLERLVALVRADERNACAKLCEAEAIDEHENGSWIACAEYLSKNIRARS
jgi:hypothetical protein